MAAYIIGEAEILDSVAMRRFGLLVKSSAAKHGGRYLVRGALPEILEGGTAHRFLVVEFENADAARLWFNSPEYAEAKAARQGASNLRLVLVEGNPGGV